MAYREFLPSPALLRHVACYWTMDADGGGVVPAHRVLPDGCMDLLFRIGRGTIETSVIGTMTEALVSPISNGRYLGVRFRPGEAYGFLDARADTLADTSVEPIAAGLASPAAIADELATGGGTAALDRWLVSRLARTKTPDERVRHAVAAFEGATGRVRTAVVAEAVGVSERQLERLFAERVGASPKVFARVVRVRSLVARVDASLASGRPISWALLAADGGYADQAHLVREVRALTGVSPRALAAERGERGATE